MAKPSGSHDESTLDHDEICPSKPRPNIRLEIGSVSHPGCVRENNEDKYLVANLFPGVGIEPTSPESVGESESTGGTCHLLIVADGMGGVAGGERASAIATETIEADLRHGFRSFLQLQRSEEAALLRGLQSAIESADRAVIEAAAAEPTLMGMGTTVTMAFGVADTFTILQVGDSRAYHLHEGKLDQVTTDHTFVQMLVNGGMITPDEARTHAKRNVVTNVVGGPEQGIFVETYKITLTQGDILLLCSDGLTEVVDNATIESILSDQPSSQAAVDALLAKALEQGGPDNITILVAKAHIET